MPELESPKIVYSQLELRSFLKLIKSSGECPTETICYISLLKNRSTEHSVPAKGKDRSPQSSQPNPPQNRGITGEASSGPNTSAHLTDRSVLSNKSSNVQWRQQTSTTLTDSRGTRNIQPQNTGNRDQTATNSSGHGNPPQPHVGGLGVRSIEKGQSNGQPSKGMSSAEQQRQQFEKERQEIELQRQNARSSVGDSNLKVAAVNRSPAFHDECDALMDELAGRSSSSTDIRAPVPVSVNPVQSGGKSNLLLGAIGLGNEPRSQPSPQGMKKISINNLFTSIAPPPPKISAPPGINIAATSASNGSIASVSVSVPYSYDRMADTAPKGTFDMGDVGEFSMESGNLDGDDDYEVSMRLIERMICGDDDYDKDDNSYEIASRDQTSSRYSFFDPPSAATNTVLEVHTSASVQSATLQQPPSAISSGPQYSGGGVSLNVNSLFAAARMQGQNNTGIVQMPPPQLQQQPQPLFQSNSYSPYSSQRDGYSGGGGREHGQMDRSPPTDVLLKLGFETQNPNRGYRGEGYQHPHSVAHHTPQKPSSSSNATTPNAHPKQPSAGHSSPFAFHSSSSGGGSSGGGSRRSSNGYPASSSTSSPVPSSSDTSKGVLSNLSASSRQQLLRMMKASTPIKSVSEAISPNPIKTKEVLASSSRPSASSVESKGAGAVGVSRDSGLQRISVSDLFNSSCKIGAPSHVPSTATVAATREPTAGH